ncbi:MAG: alpha/beta fold hydrolase [Boseongicola sp. SB0675_bin_26]|nr:alpha/beta fold hydrolase [Boseongicola sp. SB0675_bin_26]
MTWTTQPRSEAGGISFIRAGTGSRLYLVHGVGLRAEAWMAQVNKLSATQHCRAFDLPGHGASRALPRPATLAQYTDCIAAAIDAPGVVAGHSMGAMIALDLAIRHPHLVKGVAALNAIYRRSPKAAEAVRRRAADLFATELADPETTLARWFAGQDTAERRACRAWLAEVSAEHYKTAYEVFAAENGPADADLARLSCPALFMTGGAEPNSTPGMSEAMARIAPNGRAVIVERAAHMMPMTHAGDVNAELADLVREAFR